MDSALVLVLIGFNGWNWFLAMTGLSTIEFWGYRARVNIFFSFFYRMVKDMTSNLEELGTTFTGFSEHTH